MKFLPIPRGLLGAAAGLLAATAALAAGGATPARPNIIYIMADDLGYGDIGPFGQKIIKTPNLDRMAAEGTCFNNFYPGAAVCAPTRSALMTGRHTGHGRVRNNHGETGQSRVPLLPGDTTIAEVLKGAGYATGMVGKWGLGEPGTTGVPNRKGFDFWFGYLNQDLAEDYYPEKIWRNDAEVTLPGNVGGKQGQYSNDLFTDEALRFIEQQRNHPFFLYMPYTIPHLYWEVPQDSLREYAGKFPEQPLPAKNDQPAVPMPRATYAAMVTRLDREVGRVFAKLEELGLDQNTLVFFCSDNGAPDRGGVAEFFGSNGPFRGTKGSLNEGGIHTEMIARWPGHIAAHARSDFPWAGWDMMPTVAELAGVEAPPHDGISVVPALLGKATAREGYLYWEVPKDGELAQAVREGDLKAIRSGLSSPIEVYDLSSDPGEKNDLAGSHPDFVAEAKRIFRTAHAPSPDWPVGSEVHRATGKKKKQKPGK